MQTECSADLFGFARVEGRAVVAAFDGGKITSDAGALLLSATDRTIRLVDRFAACFSDCRVRELVEHAVPTLVGQRVFGIALGYEDLVDLPLRHREFPDRFSRSSQYASKIGLHCAGSISDLTEAGDQRLGHLRCGDARPLTLPRLQPIWTPEDSRTPRLRQSARLRRLRPI